MWINIHPPPGRWWWRLPSARWHWWSLSPLCWCKGGALATLSTRCPDRPTHKWCRILCLRRTKHTNEVCGKKEGTRWYEGGVGWVGKLLFLQGPTFGLVYVHEDHVFISWQNGVKLLVANRGQLCHVPVLTLVHRHVDHPHSSLQGHRDAAIKCYKKGCFFRT